MSRRRAAPIDADAFLRRLRGSETWEYLLPSDTLTPTHNSAQGTASGSSLSADAASTRDRPPFDASDWTPMLVLDTRSRAAFDGSELDAMFSPGHIRGSVHVQIPTLLLRRNSRAMAAGSPSNATGETLISYVSMDTGIERMQQLLHAVQPPLSLSPGSQSPASESPLAHVFSALDTVVLYEGTHACAATPGSFRVDSTEVAARVLLECLEGLEGPGNVYYVDGGMAAVRQASGASQFFERGPPVLAPSSLAPPPLQDTSVSPTRSLSLSISPASAAAPPPPSALGGGRRLQRVTLPRLDTASLGTRAASVDVGAVHQMRNTESPQSPASAHTVAPPLPTARPSALDTAFGDEVLGVFSVSAVVPGELYLGSDIRSNEDIDELRRLGIKAVLNTAHEIPDGGSNDLDLYSAFATYKKIPLRDTVEAAGVQQSIRTACAFIDNARLHSQPVYVHCRAGKSRSVMLVMAYLIHHRRWPLQRAYAHVLDCRTGMCPNIGFIAELMRFEERELGQRQSHGADLAPQLRRTNSDRQQSQLVSTPIRSRPHSTAGTVAPAHDCRVSPCSPGEDSLVRLQSPVYSAGTPKH